MQQTLKDPVETLAGGTALTVQDAACCWSLIWLVVTLVFAADGNRGIVVQVIARFLPVWIALAVTFALSICFRKTAGSLRQADGQPGRA